MIVSKINSLFVFFFSEERKKQFEKLIFWIATSAFILHFCLLLLAKWEIIPPFLYNQDQPVNLISSIYTPFSIILLYEIYLLIYFLSQSITIYLGKQYEVIGLIMIRKIFEDISMLPYEDGIIDIGSIKELSLTFIGLIILLVLIFIFYKLSGDKNHRKENRKQRIYVTFKKVFSLGLLLVFSVLFIKSLFDLQHISLSIEGGVYALKKINLVFFDKFFTALILTEVLLLLLTLNLSDTFGKVIRNSGFIISTILLKMSFMAEGLLNIIIVLIAIGFGIAILAVYNLFEKKL